MQAPLRIFGAGIAGLMAAYWLRRSGRDFTLYEKSDRIGGLLGTVQQNGGLAEQAANGFLWNPAIQEMADHLGLKIIPPLPQARARFLVRGGKLRRFPLGFRETLTLVARLFGTKGGAFQTVSEFGRAHLGQAATDQILAPALRGIYAAAPEELSFNAVLPDLAEDLARGRRLPAALWAIRQKRKKNSAPGKRSGTHSFASGMQEWLDALQNYLEPNLVLQADIDQEVPPSESHPVLSCLPAYETARWLRLRSHHDHALPWLLETVRYLPVVSCTVQLRAVDLPGYRPGFGCLFPETEKTLFDGILFNSSIFPGRSGEEALLSFTGIARDDQGLLRQMSDSEWSGKLCEQLAAFFATKAEKPIAADGAVFRWDRGIPLYSPEWLAISRTAPRLLEQDYPGLQLFGNYTGQLSLRGMAMATREAFGPTSGKI